eukprot:scaffold132045_cov72-Phaeocystis_antarctica.AAC.4
MVAKTTTAAQYPPLQRPVAERTTRACISMSGACMRVCSAVQNPNPNPCPSPSPGPSPSPDPNPDPESNPSPNSKPACVCVCAPIISNAVSTAERRAALPQPCLCPDTIGNLAHASSVGYAKAVHHHRNRVATACVTCYRGSDCHGHRQ